MAPCHILQTGAQGGHRETSTTAFKTDTMEIKIIRREMFFNLILSMFVSSDRY